jgi:phage-related protein (TIGR01555 family)
MSARIVNVRPKPGFLMDGAGEIIPSRDNVVPFVRDRLTNILTGQGTSADRRTWDRYAFVATDPSQVEAAYRSSWLVRKIVDVPALDMTREWRDWQTEAANIEKLEDEEKRLQLKAKCKRGLILSRLYGGGALILGTNDGDPTQPLDPKRVGAGGLTYVHLVSRHQLTIGDPILDPASPWVGKPEYFEIVTSASTGKTLRLHPSRVVEFVGQRAPEGSYFLGGQAGSWFWGDPIMQSIGQAVRNADLAQDGFAALIDRAAVDVFKFKDLIAQVATQEGEDRVTRRVAWTSQAKSTHRATILDAEDEWSQVQVTWSGIPEIMDAFLLVVAGAADIPMTRLLGQSPKGLQSTGDGEERDYQSMIAARQDEQLKPALERIDELLIPSALGSRPTDVYFLFAPLQQENEKDGAEIENKAADSVSKLAATGLFQDEVLAKAALNRMQESGRWPGLEKAIEDAENDGLADPNEKDDPSQLTTIEQRVAKMEQRGTIAANDAAILLTDASPRSLYVSRKLLNGADFIKWAKGQGFTTTVPAEELHVTVLYSRQPVDWMKMGTAWDQDSDGKLKVAAGGARLVEQLGDKGAVVLLFASSTLSWRHEDMVRNGASHDFGEYQPHVTISYSGSDIDLSKVEPYRGELIFGPEMFEEVKDDWEQSIEEE